MATRATESSSNRSSVWARFDGFELDEANARLLRNGTAVALPPRPFAVLCALARQPGCLVTKHKLLDDVWGHQFVSDSVLKSAISDLRTVLDDEPRQPRFIQTVFVTAIASLLPRQRYPQRGRFHKMSRGPTPPSSCRWFVARTRYRVVAPPRMYLAAPSV